MIKFIEDTHRYIRVEDEKELISVSALVKMFKETKDWKAIAKRSAAWKTKNGEPTTQQQLLDKWEKKRKASSEIGTLYHSIREQELLNQNQPVFYDVPCGTKSCIIDGEFKYSIPISNLENNVVYSELMIYDTDYMVCGQSDKVVVANKAINIWDYKTDEKISFVGYSSKWTNPEKFLPPISHLDDCNGNEYSIKMSLYMYMLWKANKGKLRVGDIIIEHVHLKRDPDNDMIPILEDGKPIVEKIEQIKLPYRKQEVIAILETLKKRT